MVNNITLRFDQAKVKKVEEDYKTLKVSAEQRQLIDQIAQLMQNFLPLSVMAIKGNTWYTVKQWQEENHMTIGEIARMDPPERFKTAKKLFILGKERMKHMLANPEEQKHLIDEVYDKAWKVYEQHVKQAK